MTRAEFEHRPARPAGGRGGVALRLCLLIGPLILGMLLLMLPVWLLHGRADSACTRFADVRHAAEVGCGSPPAIR
jgi:hypothetical protein